MNPKFATVAYILGILWLFRLDRDLKARTSKGLWLSVVWLWIAGSRAVSEWLAAIGLGPSIDSRDLYLDGSPVDRNVLTALLALGVIVLIRRGPKVRQLLRANRPILVFFLYCGISVLWSDYPDVAFKRWIKALGDVVMAMIVLTDPDPSTAVKRLLSRVGFLLVPLSILLINYYPDLGRGYLRGVWTPIYTGVTTGKNLLGMTCLIFGLGSAWRFLHEIRAGKGTSRAGTLIAHGTLLAMVLWLFRMADSMTSLSCFLLASGLMVATSFHPSLRKSASIHLLVVVVVSIAFSTLFPTVGGGLLGTVGRDSTLTGRTVIWDLVLGMTGSPLFGTGFESFWLGERLKKILNIYVGVNQAHNGYLEVFLNLGWIGVALLAVVIVTGYRNVVVALRQDQNAGRLKLAYFVVGVVYNFTEAGFKMLTPVWICFLLAITVVPEGALRIKTRRVVAQHPFKSQVTPCPEDV